MADRPKAEAPGPSEPAPRPRKRSGGFVAHLVDDPGNPPSCVVVGGYVGDSSHEDHTRLYFSPDLGHYVDIPDLAILYQQPIPGDPLGGTYLWVQREAEIKHREHTGERNP